MSLLVPTKEMPTDSPVAAKRNFIFPIVLGLIVLLLGGGGWYYFLGRKPKVAMSVALSSKGETSARGLWSAGPGLLLLLADGQVRLVDLVARKEKWSVKMPPAPQVDPEQQAAVNARFVRLQQWADELSRKRASLTTEAETKAFNADAAKYHVALAAARSEIADPKAAAVPQIAAAVGGTKPAYVFGGDRSTVDKLNRVSDAAAQIIEERVKKRSAKLSAMKTTLDAKKAAAKSDLQKTAVKEQEARYTAELAEQKGDEDALAKARTSVPEAAEQPDAGESPFDGDDGTSEAMAAICGEWLWIVEREHAVAFERASGAVKADVRLAGGALQVFADAETATVIASAGAAAVQITRLAKGAQPQSSYMTIGRREPAFEVSESSTAPNIQSLRTEFSAVGGSLLRTEIRLKNKSVIARDAIRPGSEKELESAAANSTAHSDDELKAVTALIRNDAARLNGQAVELVDDSTYDIALNRPFEPAIPGWSGTLRGRVQVFSTPTLHLITAGTKLLAFDRANKKAWEATLGSRMPIPLTDDESRGASQPFIEAGGRLFFADGAFLTAFDAKSGQVAWRLPSVGIRKLQMDGEGDLYVLSDNLQVEALTYATQADREDTVPITMRVGAADGKIRWQMEKYEDVWASGKDVYALREGKNSADLEKQVFAPGSAPEARIKIYKLSRGSGSPMWEWFQVRRPRAVEVQGKKVALLFGDELQVVTSICW